MKRMIACAGGLLLPLASPGESLIGITLFNELIGFDSASPGTLSAPVSISNLVFPESIQCGDVNPLTGEFFVLTNTPGAGGPSEYRLRRVELPSGAAGSAIGPFFTAPGVTNLGMDFLTGTALARFTDNTAGNFRLSSQDGSRAVDPNLTYASGDPHFGTTPNVTAIAFAADGVGYGIDDATHSLVALDNDNSGVLHTIGALGFTLPAFAALSLEISHTSGTAYLAVGDNNTFNTLLYTVNLVTGSATLSGTLGSGGIILRGLAVGTLGGGTGQDVTWIGGGGFTSDGANWDTGSTPTALDSVFIQSGSPVVDTTMESMHFFHDVTLTFDGGRWNLYGTLGNWGDIFLGDDVLTFHGDQAIQGNGDIHLEGGRIESGDFSDSLTNVENRLLGHGYLTANLNNGVDGRITASQGTLYLDQPGYNDGFINGASGGVLAFSGFQSVPFDNSFGTVRALAGGAVYLAGGLSAGQFRNEGNEPGAITGAQPGHPLRIRQPPTSGVFLGSLDSPAVPAQFSSVHSMPVLGGVDLNGDPAEFTLLPGRGLTLRDQMQLDGVIRAYGDESGDTTITVEGEVLLGGSGQGLQLGWGGRDRDRLEAGNEITNVLYLYPGQSLSGGGIVDVELTSVSGFVVANRVSASEGAYRLALQAPFHNYGFARAMEGGQMDIFSPVLRQWSSQTTLTGVVACAANSSLFFVGTEILGGTLRQEEASGQLRYFDGTRLNGTLDHPVTLEGSHDFVGSVVGFPNGEHELAGEIHLDGGTLRTSSGAAWRTLGFTDLTGFGLVWLGADGTPGAIGPGPGADLYNAVNIGGVGTVGGDGEIFNLPTGRIQAIGGGITVSGGDVTNEGSLEAGGRPVEGQGTVAGQLTIAARVFSSGDGQIAVNNDLSSLVLAGATLSGGTLYTRGAQTARTADFTTTELENLDLAGDLAVPGLSHVRLNTGLLDFFPGHEFPDSYLLVGDALGGAATVRVNGSTTLRNLGGIWLKAAAGSPDEARVIVHAGSALLTLENDATLRGSGRVQVPVANPSGRILATEAGERLIFDPDTLLPTGSNFPALTTDQLSANPDLALPNPLIGFIRASGTAEIVLRQVALAGLQLQATGAGKLVLEGLNPVLSNVRTHLAGTAQLVAQNGLVLGQALSMAVTGSAATALPALSGCTTLPNANYGDGPSVRVSGGNLVGQDGASIVAGGGGNVVANDGAGVVANDGAGIVAGGGGNIVAAGGGNIVAGGGGNIVAGGGGNIVAAGGGNIVAGGGGNIVAGGGGNIVAGGGGNIVAGGGGNIVAAGGGNIANTAQGNIVAGGGLNGAPAYGQLIVENTGKLDVNGSHVNVHGGNRNTTMVDNQTGGRIDLANQSCLRVPDGRVTNQGRLNASQSNLVTAFFSNVGNAVVSGVTWAWNGAVGAVTGFVNGVGGVLNATGSFFSRLVGGAGQPGDGGGFALVGGAAMDPSDFINEGTLLLGDGITTNTLAMGFTQTNTGTLSVQLGGTDAGDYDRLFIHGPTVLGGTLQLVFTNRFAPTLGDTFDFLVSPDFTGDFDAVAIAGLPAGHNWQFHAVFTNGGYRIVSDSTVTLPPRPLDDFRTLHGLAADGSQDFANPSGDGVPNLFKYAFNLAPQAGDLLTANARLLAHATDTAGLPRLLYNPNATFSYLYVRRRADSDPGVVYTPQIDTSLTGTWQPLTGVVETVQTIDTTWERVRLDLGSPLPAPYQSGAYLRVQVAPEP